MAAIPGRWGGLRSEPYKPNPPDADLDGIIQEQTLWERPKGFVFAMVDAAGRLAEVADGADHPPGVDVFRQNFVLARRGANGVLERVDDAPRPSWDRGDLSPRDRFGTLGDSLGTLNNPKFRFLEDRVIFGYNPMVPASDTWLERRGMQRQERIDFDSLTFNGRTMALWEPTNDLVERERRLDFIRDAYGDDVADHLRQTDDGVPFEERVPADLSELADELPEESFWFTHVGEPLPDGTRLVGAGVVHRTRRDALNACPLFKAANDPQCGGEIATGKVVHLRNANAVDGETGGPPGENPVVFRPGSGAADPGDRPDLGEGLNGDPTPEAHETAVEEALEQIFVGEDHEPGWFKRMTDRALQIVLGDERFKEMTAEEAMRNYYEKISAVLDLSPDIFEGKVSKEQAAAVIAALSANREFNNNMEVARRVIETMVANEPFTIDVHRAVLDTYTNHKNPGRDLNMRVHKDDDPAAAIDNLFETLVEAGGSRDELEQIRQDVLREIGDLDSYDPEARRQEIKTSLGLPRPQSEYPKVRPEHFSDDQLFLLSVANPALRSSRGGGGAGPIIGAMKILRGTAPEDSGVLDGPKLFAYYTNLADTDQHYRAAVDSWMNRIMIPRDARIITIFKKGNEGTPDFQKYLDSRPGGLTQGPKGTWTWTGKAGEIRWTSVDANGEPDPNGLYWKWEGTVELMRTEPWGNRHLNNILRKGNSEDVKANIGASPLLADQLRKYADKEGLSPAQLQALLWEYERRYDGKLTLDDDGDIITTGYPETDLPYAAANFLLPTAIRYRIRRSQPTPTTERTKKDVRMQQGMFYARLHMAADGSGGPLTPEELEDFRRLAGYNSDNMPGRINRNNPPSLFLHREDKDDIALVDAIQEALDSRISENSVKVGMLEVPTYGDDDLPADTREGFVKIEVNGSPRWVSKQVVDILKEINPEIVVLKD